MSNQDPNAPGSSDPWAAPPSGGQPGAWGQAGEPGGPQPYGQQPYGSQQPPPYGGQPYGQQLPQYGQFGATQANWSPTVAGSQLASWGPRVGGYLLDAVLIAVPTVILYVIGLAANSFAPIILAYLVALAVAVWFSVQVGQTGASPGMRVVGLKCVREATGQPPGAGIGLARLVLNWLFDVLCFIGEILNFLWPLWDEKNQTLTDKVVSTVVLRVPASGFSLMPKAGA